MELQLRNIPTAITDLLVIVCEGFYVNFVVVKLIIIFFFFYSAKHFTLRGSRFFLNFDRAEKSIS